MTEVVGLKTKRRRSNALRKGFIELVRVMPPLAIRDDVRHSNTVEMIDRLTQIERSFSRAGGLSGDARRIGGVVRSRYAGVRWKWPI